MINVCAPRGAEGERRREQPSRRDVGHPRPPPQGAIPAAATAWSIAGTTAGLSVGRLRCGRFAGAERRRIRAWLGRRETSRPIAVRVSAGVTSRCFSRRPQAIGGFLTLLDGHGRVRATMHDEHRRVVRRNVVQRAGLLRRLAKLGSGRRQTGSPATRPAHAQGRAW